MQSAGLLVEVAQAGGQAHDVAGAADRPRRPLDRFGQRTLQADEPTGDGSIGGELEQRMFRRLDLVRAVEFSVATERVVDDRLADVD